VIERKSISKKINSNILKVKIIILNEIKYIFNIKYGVKK